MELLIVRPLAVFSVRMFGAPIFEADGLPVEHGSAKAANKRIHRESEARGVPLVCFTLKTEWLR